MTQRTKLAGRLILAALVLSAAVGQARAATSDTPLTMDRNQLYLVADPRLKGKLEGLTMTLHPFERYSAEPIVVPEHPWEGKTAAKRGFIQLGGTVMYDDEAKRFKMWYAAWNGNDFDRNCVCYATSEDGIHWNKPRLGIHAFEGSRENNIVTLGNPADAGPIAGIYETPPLRAPGGILRVNCDARGGELRVEALGADGQLNDLRSKGECAPITGDQADAAVSWAKGPAVSMFAEGDVVRLRFHLKKANLFGFRFEN